MVANLRYGEGGSDSEHLSPEGLRVLRQLERWKRSLRGGSLPAVGGGERRVFGRGGGRRRRRENGGWRAAVVAGGRRVDGWTGRRREGRDGGIGEGGRRRREDEEQTWEYPSSKIMELLDLNEEHGAMDEDASMMFEEHIVSATTDGK
nr:hypothetical protein Iba_chr15dCG7390 [Ipomoea batatas]